LAASMAKLCLIHAFRSDVKAVSLDHNTDLNLNTTITIVFVIFVLIVFDKYLGRKYK